jgi:hypothetical protein
VSEWSDVYICGLISWLGIRIMCQSGVTCISVDCCFGELSVSLRWAIRLSQWFIMVCLWQYCTFYNSSWIGKNLRPSLTLITFPIWSHFTHIIGFLINIWWQLILIRSQIIIMSVQNTESTIFPRFRQFVTKLYDQKKSCAFSHHNINKLQVKLATSRDASLVRLPPSEAALRQHILRFCSA